MKKEQNQELAKRFSLRQLSEKTERQINLVLPLQSQPSEGNAARIHFHVRRFSKPIFPMTQNSPRHQFQRKLPPILRYLSQKCMKQSQFRREEDDCAQKDLKIFNINTHSLRKLQPFKKQATSLVRQKKVNRNSIGENVLHSMTGRKMQTKEANFKHRNKYLQQKINTEKPYQAEINKNDVISGWHIQECHEIDAYQ